MASGKALWPVIYQAEFIESTQHQRLDTHVRLHIQLIAALLLLTTTMSARAESLGDLSASFWQWRATEQPFSDDDIPRIERPLNLVIDWSPATVDGRLRALGAFEDRWRQLVLTADSPVSNEVDYRLIGSAIARVHWELLVNSRWQRDPVFYVDQTLGAVYDLLLPPPPFSDSRQLEIVARVRQIPATLVAARLNLTDIRQPFARLAIDALEHVSENVLAAETALAAELSARNRDALRAATPAALEALTKYREWLQSQIVRARPDTAIGRDNYVYFLRNVAVLGYTPDQLLAMSRQEWARAVAFEAYQQDRLVGQAASPLFATADVQIAAEAAAERKIRLFLQDNKILTVPAWLQHYNNRLLPKYLVPLQDLGETDDLTGPSRLDQDGTSYIRDPSPALGFFNRSTAEDPRSIIVHEGVPGHYFQLCLGWRHPDPIRRHYYDSGANEGIGFYAEEMMLQAGLFDDNAHTRATIYSFMRLRALRVEVDVRLALGEFTLEQAADYLEHAVPMDRATAIQEASLFATTPGQAISYQVGKLQITELLSDDRRRLGKEFSLLKFNDYVWQNGNVPISLQRWELLGDASAVPAIGR